MGTAVLVAGIIAIPYPGPGWLILFAGLAILGTEFQWAQQVLHWTRARYDSWTAWLRRQSPAVRVAVITGTGVIRPGYPMAGERLRLDRRMGWSALGLGTLAASLIRYGDALARSQHGGD